MTSRTGDKKFHNHCELCKMNQNKKECIDDLNYIRKALTKGSLYQHDAIILLIDTLTEYLEEDETQGVESGETV